MEFHSQQLVWAELVDSPHWPGVIIDDTDIEEERPSMETNKEYVAVHLLGQSKNIWIDQDLLQLYEANREQYHKLSTDPVFVKSVEEADEHLQKQKEDTQYIIAIKSKEIKVKSEATSEALVVDEKIETDYVGKDITDIFNSTIKTEENVTVSEENSKNNVPADVSKDFHVQQIVWAKMMGHPHWPAVIIEEDDINAKRPSKKSNKVHYPVQFLGENTNGWIMDSYICPYEEYRQKYYKGSKNQLFSKAVSVADEYVQKQKDDPQYKVPIKHSKKRKNDESPGAPKKVKKKEDTGESPAAVKKNGESLPKKSKKSLNGESLSEEGKNGEMSAKKSKKSLNGASPRVSKGSKIEKPSKNGSTKEMNINGFEITGIADIDKEFDVQQLVWAKMMGHPYWPAVVIDESEVNSARPPKIHRQFYPVQFLGEYANAWVENKFICPYAENKDKYYDCSKNQLFLKALDEADEYLEKRKQDSQYKIIIKLPGDKCVEEDGNRPKRRRIKEEKSDDSDTSPIKKEKTEDVDAGQISVSLNARRAYAGFKVANSFSDESFTDFHEEEEEYHPSDSNSETTDSDNDHATYETSSNSRKQNSNPKWAKTLIRQQRVMKGEHVSAKENNMEYTEQEIVWAKMVGHPHWPAVIISEAEVDADMPSSKSNKQYYPVVFLGDFTHAWVEKGHIYPYEKNVEKYSKSSKTQFFAQAIGQADEHLRKQKEDSGYKITFERSRKRKSGEGTRRSKYSPKKVERSPKKIEFSERPKVTEAFSNKTADKLKIGIIGTGTIGSEIAKGLVEAGYKVNICNRTIGKCKQIEKDLDAGDNLTILLTARNVLIKSDIIFICISDRQATKQMIEHEFEASKDTENLLKSKGILMVTSIDVNESKEVENFITKKGGKYLEVTLQGSTAQDSDASRLLLAAGDEALFHHCHPYFKVIQCSPLYFGPNIGNAIKMNLAIQMVKGISVAALSEAFNFVERCGVERDQFIKIFNKSDVASPYLTNKADFIEQNNFNSVQQPLKQMQNDLKMILDIADTVDSALPLGNSANEIYKECVRENFADYDVSAVYLKNKRKYF